MPFRGIVQKGSEEGRKLGFPTVNIPFDGALSGTFAGRVRFDEKDYSAAVYADARRKILEAHILDIHLDLYGKEIEIELLEKIRDDKVFADETEAKATIATDVQKVREYLTAASED